MSKLSKRLEEMISSSDKSVKEVATLLGYKSESIVYQWLSGYVEPQMDTLIKLADIFECSIDYLIGRTDDFVTYVPANKIDFKKQFKKVLIEKKVSQYRLTKEKVISGGNIDSWLKHNRLPSIATATRLADYLGVSVDHLIGRE